MTTQETYSAQHLPAFVGQIATQFPAAFATGVVEAAGGVPFGKPLVIGAADGQVKVPAGAGQTKHVGISVREVSASHLLTNDTDKFIQGANARYMVTGEIWVTVAENVNDGDPVFVDETNGDFYKAAATNITAWTAGTARYMTTATAGNLAKVRIV